MCNLSRNILLCIDSPLSNLKERIFSKSFKAGLQRSARPRKASFIVTFVDLELPLKFRYQEISALQREISSELVITTKRKYVIVHNPRAGGHSAAYAACESSRSPRPGSLPF